jgi:Leucine Rich repeats (2 copies)
MARPLLEAALRRDLHDEHTWTVLGDLLAAEGDTRGELIALEQRASACERPFEKAVLEHRATELFEREHRRWLGPLADVGLEITWLRGFAIEAVIGHRHVSTLAKLLELPIAALLRKLVFVRPRSLTGIVAALAGSSIERIELRLPVMPVLPVLSRASGPSGTSGQAAGSIEIEPAEPSRSIESLMQLASLVQLRELIVDGGSSEGLDALADLPRLHTLALRRGVGPIDGLAHGFAALRSLDLSARTNVHALGRDALAPVAKLAQLEYLSLHDGGWSDLSALAQLHALQHLDLRSTDTSSLAPLAKLTRLQTLDLSGCTEVTNIDALAQLERLTRLELAYTRVRRIGPLANLRALEFVELSGTPVRDLSPLFGLPALRKVGLHACEVDNVEPLRAAKVALIGVRTPEPTWRDLAEGLLARSRQRDP